jgi:predicted RNase H-like HicB family nuclease
MRYLVVIEEGPTSFGAYVPDLPGCIAVAETRDEVTALIQEAIELHIEDLRANRHPVPTPHSTSELVTVDA